MKLFIGLGNPGTKFKNNRHNVGQMVVDALHKGPTFLKSDCFMNDSGSFVKHFISLYPNHSISDLYVIHDDLDIKLGEYKIQFGKGSKAHNGILDIEEKLGTSEFWRVRVGVDNRITNDELRIKGEQYVLEDFTDEEKLILDRVIKEICKKLATL